MVLALQVIMGGSKTVTVTSVMQWPVSSVFSTFVLVGKQEIAL